MTNLIAVRSLCNAICNTFYPDDATIKLVLFNESIDADADAVAKDEQIFRVAVSLIMGYVESSRTENGVSTSVREDAIEDAIKYWCNIYGLAVEDVLSDSVRVIEDGTHLW